MYFWNIEKLKKDIIKKPLSEGEVFKYLIATTILYSLGMIPFLENNIWDIISGITSGVVTVLGLIYLYVRNGGSSGVNFLQKYLALGWVMGIRFFVLIVCPVVIIYFSIIGVYVGAIPEETTWHDIITMNLMYLVYFYLLGIHMKDIRKSSE